MALEREVVRLCVQSFHPIDPGNYEGPIHCTSCPPGTACVTALYERVPETTNTDAERNREPASFPTSEGDGDGQ